MRQIAHVGILHHTADHLMNMMAIEYLVKKHPVYLNEEKIFHDDINLYNGRDFLEEQHVVYDIIMLHRLYKGDAKLPENVKDKYHMISKKHSPAYWNWKLDTSKADFIFAFGDDSCVNKQYFLELNNYNHERITDNKIDCDVFTIKKMPKCPNKWEWWTLMNMGRLR